MTYTKMREKVYEEKKEWWKSSSPRVLNKIMRELQEKGFTDEEAFDIIEGAFQVGGAEYEE